MKKNSRFIYEIWLMTTIFRKKAHNILVSFLAMLFLCLQTTSIVHGTELTPDTNHTECVACLYVSENSDAKIIQQTISTEGDKSKKLKKKTYLLSSDATFYRNPENRGPPPRAPPLQSHIK